MIRSNSEFAGIFYYERRWLLSDFVPGKSFNFYDNRIIQIHLMNEGREFIKIRGNFYDKK